MLLPAALWLQLGRANPRRAMHVTGAEQTVQSTLYCTELIESLIRPGALHIACHGMHLSFCCSPASPFLHDGGLKLPDAALPKCTLAHPSPVPLDCRRWRWICCGCTWANLAGQRTSTPEHPLGIP